MTNNLPVARSAGEVDEFLRDLDAPAAPKQSGRLILALDATASRQPTWDRASRIQAEMFEATTALGGLDIQLVFYRGFAECKASRWLRSAADLHRAMASVSCVAGKTQIERVLAHAIRAAQTHRVGALVFVGDAMEENGDQLCRHARELGRLRVPCFTLFEGSDAEGFPPSRNAIATFREIARLSGGCYLPFELASIDRLKLLLGGIAAYAAGGVAALEAYGHKTGSEAVLQLTAQLARI